MGFEFQWMTLPIMAINLLILGSFVKLREQSGKGYGTGTLIIFLCALFMWIMFWNYLLYDLRESLLEDVH